MTRPPRRHRHASFVFAAIVGVIAGCDALAPTGSPGVPEPSGPVVLGIDWGRAASVERPVNLDASIPPDYPGTHPILRIPGQAMMVDVAALPSGGFVAVGYAPPDWQPVSWTSPDGQTWSIHPMGTEVFTFPVSMAIGASGVAVAVGWSGSRPAAWTSTDGVAWEARDVSVLGTEGVAERMRAVAAGAQGFVAGGSVGPELLDRHARFWRSADGIEWQPVADDPEAFANAEVRAITAFEGGFVAVGVVGSAQDQTGAMAWTSEDGETWTRIDDPAFDDGVAVALAPAPFGGLVAVGSSVGRSTALSWTSPDGRIWTRAPEDPTLQHSGGFAWMTDVVALGDQVVAVGDIQGLQRGTAMSWVSRDGLTWQRSNRHPVQEQGEFYAITPGGPGAMAVGSFGAPDSYVPTVWLTPGR